jgi:Arc/MetJ family transcription regulator
MKTMIDLNDDALELAAKVLGTATKTDTVNAALEFVIGRRRRIEQLLDDPYALGVGPDIADAEIMRHARLRSGQGSAAASPASSAVQNPAQA